MRVRLTRLAAALLVLCAAASCAYYNTFYLARKYYLKATDGAPYEVDREASTQRSNYSKSGDYSKKLLGVYPKSKWVDDAWLLWARTFIGTDDPLKAVAMLQEFQTRFPKSELRLDATFYLGLAYRAARKHEQAVERFDQFLDQAPKHELVPYALYERSKALMSLQRYAEAAGSVGHILQRYPGHVLYDRALRQRAEARFQQRDWVGAREDFRVSGARALTDDDRMRYLLREVDCLESGRNYDEARALLRDARAHVELPPPIPEALRVTSTPAAAGAQRFTTQAAYTPATPAQERYGRLTLRMGGVELLAGRVKDAIEYDQTVLHDYPRSQLAAEAQFRIGYAYETGEDDFARARIEYGKVRELAGTTQFSQQAQQRLDNLERIERFRTAAGADSAERKAEGRFLVAEHYLFSLERPERAVEEYRAIADSSATPGVKARALNAQAWVLARKLDRRAAADSIFWLVVRRYPETEGQLAARDYLEAEGHSVPEHLIVPPKEPVAPVLDTPEPLTQPPVGTPPLGSRPAEPGGRLGSGPGVLPPLPSRPGQSPDSLRRALVLRDSLLRAARRDTSAAGRARVDSVLSAFANPDTLGRAAKMAEIQRQIPRPRGVVLAPDSARAPRLGGADTTGVRSAGRPAGVFGPAMAPGAPPIAPIVEVEPGMPPRAARDSALRAAPDTTPVVTTPILSDDERPAKPKPPQVEPPKPQKPRSTEGFSSVWVKVTKAQRDSIKHARATEDSLRRAEKAAAKAAEKARKQTKSKPDSTAGGRR